MNILVLYHTLLLCQMHTWFMLYGCMTLFPQCPAPYLSLLRSAVGFQLHSLVLVLVTVRSCFQVQLVSLPSSKNADSVLLRPPPLSAEFGLHCPALRACRSLLAAQSVGTLIPKRS